MLADLTARVAVGELSPEEVATALARLLTPSESGAEEKAFLTAWAKRGETPREVAAAARFLLARAEPVDVMGDWNGRPLLDCSGTGGGGHNLVNVSTGIIFILAAMGIPVVKHGNRGLTKRSGSADVLEALNIPVAPHPQGIARCLEEVGAAFLFAPAYHPSFAAVAALRRELGAIGQRTIFNLLGPLLNPARPSARLIGVFTDAHVHFFAAILQELDCPRYEVVSGRDAAAGIAIGEVSANGPTLISGTRPRTNGERAFVLSPSRSKIEGGQLAVSGADESAARLTAILEGKEAQGLARETLLVNAAVAAWAHGTAPTIEDGRVLAEEALASGRALQVLRAWQHLAA